ncbi:MAG: hydroxyisourate hydrolase [Xanthomonadales bacterium]|nr:hydroxyisourate hydrolase [Xanthomonadales bacterium]
MTALTTHVLDTASGRPAAGVSIVLYKIGQSREKLASTQTNADGRCDAPLVAGEAFSAGVYELEFGAGDYYGLDEIRFLDRVVVRFGVHDSTEHYHVPLLISPYGYSTYRGS